MKKWKYCFVRKFKNNSIKAIMKKELFLILLNLILVNGEGGEVIQSGQPTHFHMEDRGPEIQVTADADGVKINAKPAGLNVVAKPGHIPATIPQVQFISTIDDIHHTPLERSRLHSIMQPAYTNPQLVHHGVEPVAYTAPIDGMAQIGEQPHYINANMPIIPPVPIPSFNYMDTYQQGLSPHFFGDHAAYHHHHHHHYDDDFYDRHHYMYHHNNHRHHHRYHNHYDYDDDDDDF